METKKPSPSDLTRHLGYWLRFVSNHVSGAFAQKVAAKGVSVAEWVVLRDLYTHEAALPSAVATRLGVTRGGISKQVDRLEARGLLVRTVLAEDARAQQLRLTAPGQALVAELAALADENDAAFFGHLSAKEKEALRTLLEGIVRRAGMTEIPLS